MTDRLKVIETVALISGSERVGAFYFGTDAPISADPSLILAPELQYSDWCGIDGIKHTNFASEDTKLFLARKISHKYSQLSQHTS